MNIPSDLYEQIMLDMDIDTLKSFCSTNKKVCLNFNFWVKKFKYDNLYIFTTNLPKTSFNWIKEYKKSLQATQIAEKILQKSTNVDSIILCEINKTNLEVLNNILPFNIHKNSMPIFDFTKYTITDRDFVNDIIINYDNLDQILYIFKRLIYYSPSVTLCDNYGNIISKTGPYLNITNRVSGSTETYLF
jgi:hypothetical protein